MLLAIISIMDSVLHNRIIRSKSNLDCEHGINCSEIYWPADAAFATSTTVLQSIMLQYFRALVSIGTAVSSKLPTTPSHTTDRERVGVRLSLRSVILLLYAIYN